MLRFWYRWKRHRCISIAALVAMATASVYFYSYVLMGPGDTGFPAGAFLSRWNVSPHCGETLSRRIHLMYKSKEIPKAFTEHVRSWARHYANFELHFWTDHGIEAFLARQYGPGMVSFLQNFLAHGVERSDVSRLLIVNHFGGMYADLDVMALRSAEPLMRNHSLILTEEPVPHAVFIYDQPSLISNAIVYSTPCHRFWRHYFLHFPTYLRDNYGGRLRLRLRQSRRHHAVFATGPIALDRLARQFVSQARPPPSQLLVASAAAFQPKVDAAAPSLLSLDRNCRYALLRAFSLTPLQRRFCRQFLDNPDSLLAGANGSVTTYTSHEYLHLGYHHGDRDDTVHVDSLLPGVLLH